MRMILLMAVTLPALAGCAPFGTRQVFSAPGKCGVLASQRLADAQASDLASGYERAIFDKSYQDCLAAQAKFGQ